jgi:uncharacterized protein (DUF58 family)
MKPTTRAATLFTAGVVIYFFANQTQVGWLYVMAALLGGLVLAAGWLNRRTLRGIAGERRFDQARDLYEGDELSIQFTLRQMSGVGSAQIRLTEVCPLAAPDSPQRQVKLFVPSLPAKSAVQFDYSVTIDRRGAFAFPDLTLASSAPFGLFRRQQTLSIPTRALVYPEVRPLARLELLDRQLAPQMTRPAAGVGYEVMGVRPYRIGDSPRHIHWRSVARSGQLVSKEFADETQPGLTLALDLFAHPYLPTEGKHTPFEWAVKLAASIGDYAHRKGYPLSLLTNNEAWPAPSGMVAWIALLEYLARVQPTGDKPLAHSLTSQPTQAFVAAILPWPDPRLVNALLELHHRKQQVLAVVLDPATFPTGGESGGSLAGALTAAGITVRKVGFGADWAGQLASVP